MSLSGAVGSVGLTGARARMLAVVIVGALAAWLALGAGSAAASGCPPAAGVGSVVNWGGNQGEQLGAGFKVYTEANPNPVLGLTGVREAKAGFEFGLAVTSECKVRSWGINYANGLGSGNKAFQKHPVPVVTTTGAELEDIKEVVVGGAHDMALSYGGAVYTWGAAEIGERGNGESGWERIARQTEPNVYEPRFDAAEVEALRPHEVEGSEVKVVQIASGGKRDYALLSNGEVMAWGENSKGRLGVAETGETCYGEVYERTPAPCVKKPKAIPGLRGVERIAAGGEMAFAVKGGGKEVYAWGSDPKGQLGNGATEDSSTPVKAKFSPTSPIAEITGGNQFALARLQNGTVYGWGSDSGGQLGFKAGTGEAESCGKTSCEPVPVRVRSLTHVVQIAAGLGAAIALKEEPNGQKVPYTFGGNGFWELLGLGEVNFTQESLLYTPTAIKGLPSASYVSMSSNKGLAVLEGAAPSPRVSITPGEGELTLNWTEPNPLGGTHEFRARLRPVGSRAFTKTVYIEPCSKEPEPTCTNTHEFKDYKEPGTKTEVPLRQEPYEIQITSEENRNGENGKPKPKSRLIVGTPTPPKGSPLDVTPPQITVEGRPVENVQAGQTAVAAPGTWNPTSGETFSYTWLRCEGLGEAGQEEEEEASECTTVSTGETFKPGQEEIGKTLLLEVEAKLGSLYNVAISSSALILAEGQENAPEPPLDTQPPALTNAKGESVTAISAGEALKVTAGNWGESEVVGNPEEKWFHCRARLESGAGATCGAVTHKVNGKEEPFTGSEYTPGSEYGGKFIEVQERVWNAGGFTTVSSAAVEVKATEAPKNLVSPKIAGTIGQLQLIAAEAGEWEGASTARPAYQWYRCSSPTSCEAITKAGKSRTYRIVAADANHTLEVEEAVSNSVGPTSVRSAPSSAVPPPGQQEGTTKPAVITAPSIEGEAKEGQTLKLHQGTWTNSPDAELTNWEWKRCKENKCKAIARTNSLTYTLTHEDVGYTLEANEEAVNAWGGTKANTAQTATVVKGAPEETTQATLMGSAQVGQPIVGLAGSWSAEPTAYEYTWKRCNASGEACATIETVKSEAIEATYTPTEADEGKTIVLEVAGRNANGAGAPAVSRPSETVKPPAPLNVLVPSISGSAHPGSALTALAGTWMPEPTSRSYRWLLCQSGSCTPIAGAEGTTYEVTSAEVGDTIEVRETATDAGGWSAATSEATAPVS